MRQSCTRTEWISLLYLISVSSILGLFVSGCGTLPCPTDSSSVALRIESDPRSYAGAVVAFSGTVADAQARTSGTSVITIVAETPYTAVLIAGAFGSRADLPLRGSRASLLGRVLRPTSDGDPRAVFLDVWAFSSDGKVVSLADRVRERNIWMNGQIPRTANFLPLPEDELSAIEAREAPLKHLD